MCVHLSVFMHMRFAYICECVHTKCSHAYVSVCVQLRHHHLKLTTYALQLHFHPVNKEHVCRQNTLHTHESVLISTVQTHEGGLISTVQTDEGGLMSTVQTDEGGLFTCLMFLLLAS